LRKVPWSRPDDETAMIHRRRSDGDCVIAASDREIARDAKVMLRQASDVLLMPIGDEGGNHHQLTVRADGGLEQEDGLKASSHRFTSTAVGTRLARLLKS
jgi:hypothetical protein